MIAPETEFERRAAECEAADHRWVSDSCSLRGHVFEMTVCGNCGITSAQCKRAIAAARASAATAPVQGG